LGQGKKAGKVKNLISIIGHLERGKVKRLALRAKRLLEKAGKECTVSSLKTFKAGKAELVIAVGGDGTLLRAVRELKGKKPVLGIAAGRKSMLMQVKEKGLEQAMEKVAKGAFKVEERARLQAIVDGKKMPLALNEVMAVNKDSAAIAGFELKAKGKSKEIMADALIIATPTGSTGHAYSAGGKRLRHGSKKIAVVASNSLGRSFKPLYLGEKSRIEVKIPKTGERHLAVVDGRIRKSLGKKLVVEKGEAAQIIRI